MNKYHVAPAAKRTRDGICFASKAEMKRFCELQLMERAGVIKDLERQPAYILADAFIDNEGRRQRAVKYVGDFRYTDEGRVVVEDVKGYWTREARLKVKLFRQRYPGVIFREVEGEMSRDFLEYFVKHFGNIS